MDRQIQKADIALLTLLLSMIAGFCDTTTFVAAKEIFSAHVTGNFIVFAYQVVKGGDPSAYLKLITFPVFIIAVIVGGEIVNRTGKKYLLLSFQGLLLLLAGLAVYVLQFMHLYSYGWPMYLCTMFVVFAMGLQNAFGKLFSKETYGPTTMMTGNVTQASLDIEEAMNGSIRRKEAWKSLKKQITTIGGFLTGCLLGAVLGQYFGLAVVSLPGIMLIVYYAMLYRS